MARPPDPVRRQELLDEVVRYLADHGLAGASLRPMAKALGVSLNGLVHHFGTKTDLLVAALARANELQQRESEGWLACNPALSQADLLRKWWRWINAAPEHLAPRPPRPGGRGARRHGGRRPSRPGPRRAGRALAHRHRAAPGRRGPAPQRRPGGGLARQGHVHRPRRRPHRHRQPPPPHPRPPRGPPSPRGRRRRRPRGRTRPPGPRPPHRPSGCAVRARGPVPPRSGQRIAPRRCSPLTGTGQTAPGAAPEVEDGSRRSGQVLDQQLGDAGAAGEPQPPEDIVVVRSGPLAVELGRLVGAREGSGAGDRIARILWPHSLTGPSRGAGRRRRRRGCCATTRSRRRGRAGTRRRGCEPGTVAGHRAARRSRPRRGSTRAA